MRLGEIRNAAALANGRNSKTDSVSALDRMMWDVVKAARLIGEATTIAYFAKRGRLSHARRIAERYIPQDCEELPLLYPVTTEIPFDAPEYVVALAGFYEESAARIAAVLEQGRNVALLCEGDPLFYGSFMHPYVRLKDRFAVTICPGITGMSGCWTATGMPMKVIANIHATPTHSSANQKVRICQRKCDSSQVPRASLRRA